MARENLEITLAPRSVLGKKLRQLRRDGFVPAHMYGQALSPHPQLETMDGKGPSLEIRLLGDPDRQDHGTNLPL